MHKDNATISIGVSSKLGNLVCKYPLRVALILVLVIETLLFVVERDPNRLLRSLWVVPLALSPSFTLVLLLIYVMGRKWCYKIEIDKSNNFITFYRFFNRGVKTFLLNNIKIIVGAYCHIVIDDSEFILHGYFIHDLVAHLPQNTIIEYKGRAGNYMRKEWEKYNRPLIPGEEEREKRI